MTPGPTLPSRLLGWVEEPLRGNRPLALLRSELEVRRIRLIDLLASAMAVVLPRGLFRVLPSEVLLVLRDNVVVVWSGCFETMASGSCKGVTSSSPFSCPGSSESGEPCRELAVVRLATASIDWVGEPCCELGHMVEADELLTADGGITTSWACDGGTRSVRTWLGREERLLWRRSGVMGEEVEGSNGRGESVETDMISTIVAG